MKTDLLDRIKSRGYWRINFQPRKLISEKSSLAECHDIVKKNALHLRGWSYPFVPTRDDSQQGSLPSGEFFEAWIDWLNHIEYWRNYRSHQFLHYLALREDWMAESNWSDEYKKIPPGQLIGTSGAIWQITEVFEFLSRLSRDGFYPSGALVSLTLENTNARQLWVDVPNRMPFLDPKRTGANRIEIAREILPTDFPADGAETARSAIIEFFDHFGWTASHENVKEQQEALLSGKL